MSTETQTVESDEDSVDGIPDRMTYGDRITFLEHVALVSKYDDVIDEIGEETFRMKHVELDRSDIHTLRNCVIEDSGNSWGRQTNWRWTESALQIHEMLQFPGYEYLTLTPQQWMTLERNSHELHPDDIEISEREFEAAEYDWSSALLASLHDAGFVERVEKNVGEPDVWTLTPSTVSLLEWLHQDDDWM